MSATFYRIASVDPHAHLFEVSCTINDPEPAGQSFRLPAWIPGSYLIREFARHFVTVRASASGRSVGVQKTGKDEWQVEPCAGPLTLTADVYAFDLSVRAAYLDGTRGYFNGPSVFVWPVGREQYPCDVEIVAPTGAAQQGWRVATTLASNGAPPMGFGRYRAANYDELIDHPVEMGQFDVAHFDAGGVRHDIVVSGRHRGDLDRLARDLQRVCQTQIDLFGGAPGSQAPFSTYMFQLLVLGEGRGGLEHRSSTSLVCKRDGLPQVGATEINDDYLSLLGLASHEYFHAWNVKRIKPAAFVPYDLTRENLTRQLWAFEGITSYYDDLMLVRSKLIDIPRYLELIGRSVTKLLRTPARSKQSVGDSSFDAWIKYYRQDENAPNAVVSYYVKGSLIALALDLTLRARSKVTLDDVMRELWRRHGLTGVGVPEGGIDRIASELSGVDLRRFFADYVYGIAELPLESLLAEFGIDVKLRQAEGSKDEGGSAGPSTASRLWLGASMAPGADLRLRHVTAIGPAARAGLSAGDAIVAVDGLRATAAGMQRLLATRAPGDAIDVQAFRRDELMSFRVTLESAPADTCWLVLSPQASASAEARRVDWLGPLAS